MSNNARKVCILVAKILVAGALLAWVIAQVHWRDYVLTRSNGRTYPVLAAPGGGATARRSGSSTGPSGGAGWPIAR